MYVYLIILSSLFTTIFFKQAKTVCREEPKASFCDALNELNINSDVFASKQTKRDNMCKCVRLNINSDVFASKQTTHVPVH